MSLSLFSELGHDEKVDFFRRCQKLLVKHSPNSPWVLRGGAEPTNMSYFLDVFIRYKGIIYETDDMILLFNKRYFEDEDEIHHEYHNKLYDPPDKNPNTYTIDFIASSLSEKILKDLEPYFNDPGMKHVCFLRGAKLSVFDAESFKNAMKNKFFT